MTSENVNCLSSNFFQEISLLKGREMDFPPTTKFSDQNSFQGEDG